MYDHVLGAEHAGRDPKLTGPYSEADPFHEPLIAFAYLAGITRQIEFTTGVIVLPQRQSALVAKQAADIDLFSGGRLRLGVGVGWNWVEFDALEMGPHFRRRGKREEDQIALMRKLWTEPVVTYSDRDHRVERAGLCPLPGRSIPIWLGGFSPPAFDRAARIADGFLFSARTQDEALQIKASMAQKLRQHGRGNEPFGFEQIQQYGRGPDAWPRDIAAWRDAGGSHISVVTMNAGLKGIDAHIEAIRRWREVYDALG
jgi:probable F420-dependent oxidoreductase